MTQKEIAISFLQLAGLGNVDEAFDKYISKNFIHHNQYFKGDRESLKNAMAEDHMLRPNKSIDIKYCYEDTQTVITHSLVIKEVMQIAVVHIFRFENNQIAEAWDLGQIIDNASPNENGPF